MFIFDKIMTLFIQNININLFIEIFFTNNNFKLFSYKKNKVTKNYSDNFLTDVFFM